MLDKPRVKEYAEFFRLGLCVGIIRTQEVARWADSMIEKEDKPPIEVIEVTLACNRNANETISCLRQVKGEVRPDVPINLLAAYLLKRLQENGIDHGKAIRALYKASWSGGDSELELEIMMLEDSWCLAEDGIYGNPDDLKKEIDLFLEVRRDYLAYLPIE
jgi:hypothetical protein